MQTRQMILVATEDTQLHRSVEKLAAARGWSTSNAGNITELLAAIEKNEASVIVLDEALPGDPNLALVLGRRNDSREPPARLVLALGETSTTGRDGIDAYLRKPIDELIGGAILDDQLRMVSLQQRLTRMSSLDDLTGLVNRRVFRERFDEECRRCWRYQRPFSVLMVGIDRLQSINSRFGDQAGDRLLVDAARICVRELRDMDVVARWGGAEFALLAPETPLGHGLIVAARLRGLLCELTVGEDESAVNITASMGVAGLGPDDTTGVEQLIRWAEEALAQAKDQGRNGVFFHTPSGAVRFAEVGV